MQIFWMLQLQRGQNLLYFSTFFSSLIFTKKEFPIEGETIKNKWFKSLQ